MDIKEWEKGNFSLDHVFITSNGNHTLLTGACDRVDLKVVNLLIKLKADVNKVGTHGFTPLILAIEKECDPKNKGLVDLLMKAKADVNAAAENQYTPIFKAVERSNLKVCKALIEAGANLNVSPEGMTLLKWAEIHEQQEDMKKIINTLKGSLVAASTSTNNSQQGNKVENATPTTSLEDEAPALKLQVDNQTAVSGSASSTPIANNGTSVGGTVNSSPKNNKTPRNNGAGFWSEHKGKIALGVAGLCVAGAVAAYVFAYPVVALILTVLAAVILMGAGIAKVLENPSVEKPLLTQQIT